MKASRWPAKPGRRSRRMQAGAVRVVDVIHTLSETVA
jgi:hypothetical protein